MAVRKAGEMRTNQVRSERAPRVFQSASSEHGPEPLAPVALMLHMLPTRATTANPDLGLLAQRGKRAPPLLFAEEAAIVKVCGVAVDA